MLLWLADITAEKYLSWGKLLMYKHMHKNKPKTTKYKNKINKWIVK